MFRLGGDEFAFVLTNALVNDALRLKLVQERRNSGYAFAQRHPPDAVKVGDRWYKFYADPTRWHLASTICEKLGGSLAIVDSPAKNDAVARLALAQAGKSELVNFWVGGSDEEKEGEFHWADGALVGKNGFANWRPGEPNNINGTQDWIQVIVRLEQGQVKIEWDDQAEGDLPFVCEWDH